MGHQRNGSPAGGSSETGVCKVIKFKSIAIAALLVGTSLASWATGPAPAPSNWEQFKAFTHKQKNEAVAEGKKLIAATDKKIDELSKQAKASTGETKAAHEKNMKELVAKKKEAQAQLDKMGKATSDAWDAAKESFTKAGKDLHAAHDKAAPSEKK
jgi:hypothetical protein